MTPADLIATIAASIGVQATICTTPEQLQSDREFVADCAVLDALEEVYAAPFVDGWSREGYDYLGTRMVVSGGEVCEIDAQPKEDSDSDNLPF